MKISELLSVTSKAMTVYCFEQYDSKYDNYGEVKEERKIELNEKEVVMLESINAEEINIYYK